MDQHKRKLIEGWRDKSQNQLGIAEDCLKHFKYSESIQASQECIELSVKALLLLLNIDYPSRHEWKPEDKSFDKIASQIRDKKIIEKLEAAHYPYRIPRLMLIVNFWAQFYGIAKYGIEKGNLASARDLFPSDDEAKLAIKHAHECDSALSVLFYFSKEQIDAITGESDR